MKERLLNTIACPKCFGKLDYDEKQQQLICHQDLLRYAIVDGIPVLLENEATQSKSPESEDNL